MAVFHSGRQTVGWIRTVAFTVGIAVCMIGLVLTSESSAQPAHEPNTAFPVVRNGTIEGAIIPADRVFRLHNVPIELGIDAQDVWTPTPDDIVALESRLRGDLEFASRYPNCFAVVPKSGKASEVFSKKVQFILANYDTKYRRQYLGFVIDGARVILVNSFDKSKNEDFRKRFIATYDGGPLYWHILYSVGEKRFAKLHINGPLSQRRDPKDTEEVRRNRRGSRTRGE